MVLRPKHTLEPSDYQNNVLSLGSLLVKLSTTSEKNDKAPPGSSNAHVQSTPSTSTFANNAFEDHK